MGIICGGYSDNASADDDDNKVLVLWQSEIGFLRDQLKLEKKFPSKPNLIEVGDKVVVVGLAEESYNGKIGTVFGVDGAGRFNLDLGWLGSSQKHFRRIAVRQSNLKRVKTKTNNKEEEKESGITFVGIQTFEQRFEEGSKSAIDLTDPETLDDLATWDLDMKNAVDLA